MDNVDWIPVTEQLPKRWQRVLVTVRYNIRDFWGTTTIVSTAKYHGNNIWSIDYCNALPWTSDEIDSSVTAWKPLPEEYDDKI